MPHTETEILAFLSEPLPNDVLQAMMDAVEAYGALKGAMLHGDAELLEKLLLIRELRLIRALSGIEYSYEEIIAGLSIKNEDNEIYKQAAAYEKCKTYLVERLPIYKIIPATDHLRINGFLQTYNPSVLSDQLFADAQDVLAQAMNEDILKVLYGLNYKHHIFIRIAVTYHLLDLKFPDYKFNVLALNLLFSIFAQGNLPHASIWLAKYKILNADWGYDATIKCFKNVIIKFLTYLKDEFYGVSLMIQKRKTKTEDMAAKLRKDFPKIYAGHFADLLCNNLCLRNKDFLDKLRVTPMTAIKYARALEEKQYIAGFEFPHFFVGANCVRPPLPVNS